MRVLILGSGAREHAIAWKYSKSRRITGLYTAPGNAGTSEYGINLSDISQDNSEEIISACKKYDISHVIVSSAMPLAKGLIDSLSKEGIKAIGPHKNAAKLEWDKVYSKNFMKKYNIPTTNSIIFNNNDEFVKYINNCDEKYPVLKRSGLAESKGVLVSSDPETLLNFGSEILKKDTLLVEEFLEGCEISVITLYDGDNYKLLPFCSDFKRAAEGDTGSFTGGMGAICPAPFVGSSVIKEIEKSIIAPTFEGIAEENLNYTGILCFDIIITNNGPKLIEYKLRLGDPETQVLIPIIDSDLGNIAEAMLNKNLDEYNPRISSKLALAVTVAAEGYPDKYNKDIIVNSIPTLSEKDAFIFHSSTKIDSNKNITTGTGRCFTCVGLGSNIIKANAKAYEAAKGIVFDGAWYRKDIGKKFFSDDYSD